MSTAVMTTEGLRIEAAAESALRAAARLWFVVTIIGQLAFAFAVASFYGLTALRGDYHGWSKFISHGLIAGDTRGNFAVAMHVTSAAIIMLSGAVQLIPGVRKRVPVFHRWNGRLYMLAAVSASAAGVYMTWFRGSIGDVTQHVGGTLAAVLIWLFAALALRYAMARDFRTHRRWALRLFMVVSAAWFYRIVFFLSLLIFKGPWGFDPTTFTGPFPSIMSFGQYLIPLAILEIYFRAQDGGTAFRRFGTAAGLVAISLAMCAGLFAVAISIWTKQVKAGFDPRTSIAETLSSTISSSGIDAAIKQYQDLKSAGSPQYNFDEGELNTLGYQLIRKKKFADAIRIFQLNVDAYPQSSNAYDSLAEGYVDIGDKLQAIANYKKAIELNPKNGNSIAMLRKLQAQ